jgi:uncharacterized protein
MKKNCDNCNAECCRYVVIEWAKPKTQADIEELKWFICHENINIFIDEEDSLNVEFVTPCKYLKDNKCSIYKKRPLVCKEYSSKECTFHNEYKEKISFSTPEEIERYFKKIKK